MKFCGSEFYCFAGPGDLRIGVSPARRVVKYRFSEIRFHNAAGPGSYCLIAQADNAVKLNFLKAVILENLYMKGEP